MRHCHVSLPAAMTNSSNLTVTDWAKLDPSFTKEVRIFFGVLCLTVVVAGVVGNSLVCLVVIRKKLMRNSTNILIANLAFVDLLQCLNLLTQFFTLAAGEWLLGHTGCQVSAFLVVCLVAVSLYLLALISVNRFLLTRYPSKHRALFTSKRTTLMIMAIWVWALISATPPLLGHEWAAYVFRPERCLCTMNFDKSIRYFVAVGTLVLLVPVTVIAVVNWKIFKVVRKSRRQIQNESQYKTTEIELASGDMSESQVTIKVLGDKPLRSSSVCDDLTRRNEKIPVNSDMSRITFMLFIIAFIFAIVYTPTITINLIEMVDPTYPINIWVDMFFTILAFSNHAINPFVYGAMNKEYRKAFKRYILFC